FSQEFQKRAPEAKLLSVDSALPLAALRAALPDTGVCSAVVVVSSVTSAVYNDKIDLPGALGDFVRQLTDGPAPVAFVSLGSPYLLEGFPKVAAFLAAFGSTPVSETAGVKALFGEIPITGTLPVTIPGFAKPGDGIQLPSSGTARR